MCRTLVIVTYIATVHRVLIRTDLLLHIVRLCYLLLSFSALSHPCIIVRTYALVPIVGVQ